MTPGDEEPSATRAVFRAGDAIRGWGSLGVILFHLAYYASEETVGSPRLNAFGRGEYPLRPIEMALISFFVLSGYLISRPFARAFVLGLRTPQIGPYAMTRAGRIIPTMFVIAPVCIFFLAPSGASWHEILAVFAFVQIYDWGDAAIAVGPAWSLDVEMAFYVITPILFALFGARATASTSPTRRAWLATTALVALMAASVALRGAHPNIPWGASPLTTICVFVPGLILAVLEPLVDDWRRTVPHRLVLAEWSSWFAGVAGTVAYSASWSGPFRPFMLTSSLRAPLAIIGGGGFVAAFLIRQWRGAGCPPFMEWRPIVWLGERSYPFYIGQQAIIIFILEHFITIHQRTPIMAFVVLSAVVIPVNLALAVVVHRWVEKPGLQWSHERAKAMRRPATSP